MSIARKCDRCGKYFDPFDESHSHTRNRLEIWFTDWTIALGPHSSHKDYDICPGCMVELEKWLGIEEKPNE